MRKLRASHAHTTAEGTEEKRKDVGHEEIRGNG